VAADGEGEPEAASDAETDTPRETAAEDAPEEATAPSDDDPSDPENGDNAPVA
jgi:hypothetical protein